MGTQVMDSLTQNAKNSGLNFHFEKNHYGQFIQCTPTACIWQRNYDKSNELEELLFKTYLTDGKNINNLDTLSELGLKQASTKMKLKLYYIPMLCEAVKRTLKWRRT
jgi:protein disulfide-isomerase